MRALDHARRSSTREPGYITRESGLVSSGVRSCGSSGPACARTRGGGEVKHSKRSSLSRWRSAGRRAEPFLGICIRLSRCQFGRLPVRSGFEHVFAHGRARAASERPNSLELPPPWHHLHKQKRWKLQRFRSPGHRSACCVPLHSNEARTHRQSPKRGFRRFVEKPEAH